MKKFLLLLTLLVSFGGMVHADTWIKVTSAADLSLDGEYIIVAQSGSKAMSTTFSSSYMGVTTDALTISNNKITDVPENIAVVSLEGASLSDCKVKISTLTGESKGYWTTSAAKKMSLTSNGTSASITYNSNYTQIKFSTYGTLYYNTASPRFLNYTSTQGKIDLFKKEALTGPQDYTPLFGDVTLEIGQTHQLELGDNHPEVLFISNNDNIATVDDATGLITAVAAGTTDITATWDASNEWNEGETTFKVTVTKPLQDAGLAYSAAEAAALLGEAFDAPVLSNPNNLAVTYTSSDEKVATIDAEGIVTIGGAGTTTIKAAFAGNDEFRAAEASYTLTVTDPNIAPFETALTSTAFNTKGTGYKTYECTLNNVHYIAFTNGAYASGESQSNVSKAFGLRGKTDAKTGGGIITTQSIGIVKSITVTQWTNQTANDRKLKIYGQHTPYSNAEVLTNNVTGDFLGEISLIHGEAEIYEVYGNYEHIAIFPATNDAVQLSEINVAWGAIDNLSSIAAPTIKGGLPAEIKEGDNIQIFASLGTTIYYKKSTSSDVQALPKAAKSSANIDGWESANSNAWTYQASTPLTKELVEVKAVSNDNLYESKPIKFMVASDGVTTGVEAIEAEGNEAEVEWFNLQGVRVENPAQGLYIRRQGNKVEKVAVK